MSKNILAIIGLRSGSKGLKNKNIRNLAGKPLFTHILKKAKNSQYINRIIVSTDSLKYKKIINMYGGKTPYMRPKKYSKDSSPEIVELSTSDDVHMELPPPVSSHASDISFIDNTEEKGINEKKRIICNLFFNFVPSLFFSCISK